MTEDSNAPAREPEVANAVEVLELTGSVCRVRLDDGRVVGVEHRYAVAIAEALDADTEPVPVTFEAWQVVDDHADYCCERCEELARQDVSAVQGRLEEAEEAVATLVAHLTRRLQWVSDDLALVLMLARASGVALVDAPNDPDYFRDVDTAASAAVMEAEQWLHEHGFDDLIPSNDRPLEG